MAFDVIEEPEAPEGDLPAAEPDVSKLPPPGNQWGFDVVPEPGLLDTNTFIPSTPRNIVQRVTVPTGGRGIESFHGEGQLPGVPSEAEKLVGYRALRAEKQKPFVPIPRLVAEDPRFQAFLTGALGRPPTPLESAGSAAVFNTAKTLPEFFESMEGLALTAVGATPVGRPAVASYFTFTGLQGAKEALEADKQIPPEATLQQRLESKLNILGNLAVAGAAGHGIRRAEVRATTEPPSVQAGFDVLPEVTPDLASEIQTAIQSRQVVEPKETYAYPKQSAVESLRGEPAGPAPQVAAGTPGELREPAGAREPIQAAPVSQPAGAAPQASVTDPAVRRQLMERGYTRAQIMQMTPEELAKELTPRPIEEEPLVPPSEKVADPVDHFLDNLKSGVEPSAGHLGTLNIVPKVWDAMVEVIRATYHAGRDLAKAIESGIAWLRNNHPDPTRDETELRQYLQDNVQPSARGQTMTTPIRPTAPTPSYEEIKARREQVNTRLGEITAQRSTQGQLPDKLRAERFDLAKESRAIERELLTRPEHVAGLLRQQEALFTELEAARQAGDRIRGRTILDGLQGLADSELSRIKPELYESVRRELEAKREIAPLTGKELPAGRTLGHLVSWLNQHQLDSPRRSLRERFSLARRLAEEWQGARDSLGKAAARVSAAWQAFKTQWRAPPLDTPFRSVMKDWFFEKQWTGLETHRWIEEIRRQIPQPVRRAALSVWVDADGNEALLRSQMETVPARFRPVWRTALQLTTKEQALGRRIQADFEEKLNDALNLGLVERGRANYGVPQIWKVIPKFEGDYDPSRKPQGKARQPTAKLDPRSPFFALQRTHESYFDGIMAGGIPKSLDIGDLVDVYNADFHNSLADRQIIWALKDVKAADGSPVVKISGSAHIEPRPGGARLYLVDSARRPKDAVTVDGRPYVFVNHWALRDWKYAATSEEGNPILVRGDFLVHPDHAGFLRNELGQSWFRDPEGGGRYFNWVLNSAAFLKASKLASATFHMATLAEHSMFHAFAGKPSLERLALLWPSIRGVELDPAKNPQLVRLMRHGANLGFDHQRELFEEGLASHGGIWARVPGLGDLMTRISDFTFKEYLPKLKVKTGLVILQANDARYHERLSPDQIAELSANQANAAFGAQNWRLLGTNKTLLDINRLLFLAPDFLLSRVKVVAQALKPYNREQLLFLLAQAGLVYIAARILNTVTSDDHDPHFEPEHAFSLIYGGRAYSARFIVSDIWHLLSDTRSFLAGRLSPVSRIGIETITGRDLRTGMRKAVPIETDNQTLRAAQLLLKGMVEWLIPIGVEGFVPGAAQREQTPGTQAALSLVGVGSRKYTAQTQMWQLARDFNRASPDKSAQLYQRERDAEAKQESVYRGLDNLLDAGDLSAARKEYERLIQEGYKPINIQRRYLATQRPFTGTQYREAQFRRGLTEGQRTVYQEAISERVARWKQFNQMLTKRNADKR